MAAIVTDTVAVESLVQMAATELQDESSTSVHALNALSAALDAAEAQFAGLVGDATFHASQRAQHAIGRLLHAVKAQEEFFDEVYEKHLENNEAPLEAQVAALHFLLACLTAWHFVHPLTEETFVMRLQRWATTEPDTALGDKSLLEARQTYAMGLLAIALTHGETCDEAVRAGLINYFASLLHRAVSGMDSSIDIGLEPVAGAAQVLAPPASVQPPVRINAMNFAESPVEGAPEAQPGSSTTAMHADTEGQGWAAAAAESSDGETPFNNEPGPSSARLVVHPFSQPRTVPACSSRVLEAKAELVALCTSPPNPESYSAPDIIAADDAFLLDSARDTPMVDSLPEPPTEQLAAEPPGASQHPICRRPAVLEEHAGCLPHPAALAALRLRHAVQCAACMGEYLECLGPLLAHGGVRVVLRLLDAWRLGTGNLADALRLLGALLAHRKFADALVDAGGVQLLLGLPRNQHTHTGLSLAFFGLSSIPSAFDQLCALSEGTPAQVVELALAHLACGHDPARKNAALFLGASLHNVIILEAFDRADGPGRLLSMLRASLLLLRHGNAAAEMRYEKQVAFHATQVLRQWCRTHLMHHIASLQRRLAAPYAARAALTALPRALEIDQESVEGAFACLDSDARIAEAFLRQPWPATDAFLAAGGAALMLDFVQASPGERYFNEMAYNALEVLHIMSLKPACRSALLPAAPGPLAGGSQQQGVMGVLLAAAGGQSYLGDHEVMYAALNVILNCVAAPPSMQCLLPKADQVDQALSPCTIGLTPGRRPAPMAQDKGGLGAGLEAGYVAMRRELRAANGLRTLLSLLYARSSTASLPGLVLQRMRALTTAVLWGLSRDAHIRHILAKLKVGKLLADLVHEADGISSSRRPAPLPGDGIAAPAWRTGFTSNALELIALITPGMGSAGTEAARDATGPALHKMERAAIAAASHITYDPSELLLLIRDHLAALGLHSSAEQLTWEASLSEIAATAAPALPATPAEPLATTAKKRGMGVASSLLSLAARNQAQDAADSKTAIKTTSGKLTGHRRKADGQPEDAQWSTKRVAPAFEYTASRTLSRIPVVRCLAADFTPQPGDRPSSSRPAPSCSYLHALPTRRLCREAHLAEVPATPHLQRAKLSSAVLTPGERRTVLRAGGGGTEVDSRLSAIMVQYLSHQHRTACMAAETPVSTLPPLSLVHPNVLPQAKKLLDAPGNVATRLKRRQAYVHGGYGGQRQDRRLVFSRFRHTRSIREEDDAVLKSCAFIQGGSRLLVGTHAGQLRMYEAGSGEFVDVYQEHLVQSINQLRVHEPLDGPSLLLASTRNIVRLWNTDHLDREPLHVWPGSRGGVFSPDGRTMACTARCMATVCDVERGPALCVFEDAAACSGGTRGLRDVCYNATGELLLWGPTLYDPRAPRRVHAFDLFADSGGASSFHPAGLEAVLNSEVWDLRTLRLLRSVESLDSTALAWSAGGDIAFATLRRTTDDLAVVVQPRRTQHPLHTAFRTVDATDYADVATVEVDGRCIVDLALDGHDGSLALISVEPEGLASSARIYDIGRQRLQGDESEWDGDDGEDNEEDDAESDGSGLESESDAEALAQEVDAATEAAEAEDRGGVNSEAGSSEDEEDDEADLEYGADQELTAASDVDPMAVSPGSDVEAAAHLEEEGEGSEEGTASGEEADAESSDLLGMELGSSEVSEEEGSELEPY